MKKNEQKMKSSDGVAGVAKVREFAMDASEEGPLKIQLV